MRLGRVEMKYSAEAFDLVNDCKLDFIEICCNNLSDMENLVAARKDVAAQIERTGI